MVGGLMGGWMGWMGGVVSAAEGSGAGWFRLHAKFKSIHIHF
jgi:hypothetical protein